jgi:hypothetical protein
MLQLQQQVLFQNFPEWLYSCFREGDVDDNKMYENKSSRGYMACRIMLLILSMHIICRLVYTQSPSLGAIRWDAWTGTGNAIGIQVEQALSPGKYHYRVPFFGVETDTVTVKIDGTTQAIMDQEIDFARYAGLDYWAFVWYASSSGLDEARRLYDQSAKKNLIDYCLIIEQSWFNTEISIADMISEFKDPSYFRVLDGRPLIYILGYTGIHVADIDSLRARSMAAGTANPYIVELRVDGNMNVVDEWHMDAFGMYATSWISNGSPYADLAEADIDQWNWVGINNGKKVVPHVTTGWDTRPIHDHPLNWYTVQNADDYVEAATPAELVNHVTEALDWVKSHPSLAEANTVLIYAWNEHVEGGWICPTLSNYGSTERIDALHAMFGLDTRISNEGDKASPILVYPNPTNSYLMMNIQEGEAWSVRNLLGFELLKGSGSICDFSSLPTGMYLIQVMDRVARVVKN